MAYAWPIIPKTGMLNFNEALVVASLYKFSRTPDDDEVFSAIENNPSPFIKYMESQQAVFAEDCWRAMKVE